MIKIENVTIGFNQIANAVELIQGSYQLDIENGCEVKVNFFEDNNLKSEVLVDIPKEVVAAWTTDNQVLINYVLNKLGIIVLPNLETL